VFGTFYKSLRRQDTNFVPSYIKERTICWIFSNYFFWPLLSCSLLYRLISLYLSGHPCDLSSNLETARGTVSASFIYLKLQDYFSYQRWRSWCASHSHGKFPLATRHSRTAFTYHGSSTFQCVPITRLYESQPRSCHLGTALPKSKNNPFNYTCIGNAIAGNIRKYICIIID